MHYEEEFILYQHIGKMTAAYEQLDTLLERHNDTNETAYTKAMQYRSDFFSDLETLALPASSLPAVCSELIIRLETQAEDPQLQWIFARLISDAGLLYGPPGRGEEQSIRNFYRQSTLADRILHKIQESAEMHSRLHALRIEAKRIKACMQECPEEEEQICRLIQKHFFIINGCKHLELDTNVRTLLRILNSNPILRQAKAYLLWTTLQCKRGMMTDRFDYIPNLVNVLEPVKFTIYKDNTHNFAYYRDYTLLYEHLRRFYEHDRTVDLAFCDFCFSSLNNLSEWYYLNYEPNVMIPKNIVHTLHDIKSPVFPVLLQAATQDAPDPALADRVIESARVWMPDQKRGPYKKRKRPTTICQQV